MRRHAKQYTHSRSEMADYLLACRAFPDLTRHEWISILKRMDAPKCQGVWFATGGGQRFELGVDNPRTRLAVAYLPPNTSARLRKFYAIDRVMAWAVQSLRIRCLACRLPIAGKPSPHDVLCEECYSAGKRLAEFSFNNIVEWALVANIRRNARRLKPSATLITTT